MILSNNSLFLDCAAAMPAEKKFIEYYMQCALENGYINQESIHSVAMQNRKRLENAEKQISRAFAHGEHHVHWAATGSEAISLLGHVLQAIVPKESKVILTPDHHKSVISSLELAFGKERLIYCPILPSGAFDLEKMNAIFSKENIGLVAVPHVVSETGFIHDLNAVRDCMNQHQSKALLFVDMVQAAGKVPSAFESAKIDFAVCSAHKLGTIPVAAVIYRPKAARAIFDEMRHQYRAGRPDLASCESIAFAAETYANTMSEHNIKCEALKLAYKEAIQKVNQDKKLNIHFFEGETSPWILSFCLPKYQGAIIVRMLSELGIHLGSGSACQSENPNPSYVLEAMKVPRDVAFGLVRVSFSPYCEAHELERFITAFEKVIQNY